MFDIIALSVVHVALFLLLVTFAGSDNYIFNQCELQGFLRNMAKTRIWEVQKLVTKITCTKCLHELYLNCPNRIL